MVPGASVVLKRSSIFGLYFFTIAGFAPKPPVASTTPPLALNVYSAPFIVALTPTTRPLLSLMSSSAFILVMTGIPSSSAFAWNFVMNSVPVCPTGISARLRL